MAHTDIHAATEARVRKTRDTSKLDPKTKDAVKKIDDNNTTDQSVYPHNKQKTTAIGHKWELNETEGNEYINLRHGLTGSYIKLLANGDVQIHSPIRDVNVMGAKNVNVKAGSKVDKKQKDLSDRLSVHVVGNCHLEVEGDMHQHVKGDKYETVNGTYTLNVKNRFAVNANDLGLKCLGTYQVEANKIATNGQNVDTTVTGGAITFNYAGGFVLNTLTPGSTISFNGAGNFEVNIASDCIFNIGGKEIHNIAGVSATGGVSPVTPAFAVTTALGGISMVATLGVGNYFAGGPYLDVDCLTGVYLN
jgi:hypothetical protein